MRALDHFHRNNSSLHSDIHVPWTLDRMIDSRGTKTKPNSGELICILGNRCAEVYYVDRLRQWWVDKKYGLARFLKVDKIDPTLIIPSLFLLKLKLGNSEKSFLGGLFIYFSWSFISQKTVIIYSHFQYDTSQRVGSSVNGPCWKHGRLLVRIVF